MIYLAKILFFTSVFWIPTNGQRSINPFLTSSEEIERNDPFSYSYKVKDMDAGNDYTHGVVSDGKTMTGEYKVLLPDGRMQKVSYTADERGYNAVIQYEDGANVGARNPPRGSNTASQASPWFNTGFNQMTERPAKSQNDVYRQAQNLRTNVQQSQNYDRSSLRRLRNEPQRPKKMVVYETTKDRVQDSSEGSSESGRRLKKMVVFKVVRPNTEGYSLQSSQASNDFTTNYRLSSVKSDTEYEGQGSETISQYKLSAPQSQRTSKLVNWRSEALQAIPTGQEGFTKVNQQVPNYPSSWITESPVASFPDTERLEGNTNSFKSNWTSDSVKSEYTNPQTAPSNNQAFSQFNPNSAIEYNNFNASANYQNGRSAESSRQRKTDNRPVSQLRGRQRTSFRPNTEENIVNDFENIPTTELPSEIVTQRTSSNFKNVKGRVPVIRNDNVAPLRKFGNEQELAQENKDQEAVNITPRTRGYSRSQSLFRPKDKFSPIVVESDSSSEPKKITSGPRRFKSRSETQLGNYEEVTVSSTLQVEPRSTRKQGDGLPKNYRKQYSRRTFPSRTQRGE